MASRSTGILPVLPIPQAGSLCYGVGGSSRLVGGVTAEDGGIVGEAIATSACRSLNGPYEDHHRPEDLRENPWDT